MKTGTVDGITPPGDVPQYQVHVSTDSPDDVDGIGRIRCPGWYVPAFGDQVILFEALGGQFWVFACQSRSGVAQPSVPSIVFGNGPPSDASRPGGTVYDISPAGGPPTLYVAYGTTVTPPAGPLVVTAVASRTWDTANNWRGDSARVYQGDSPDGSTHDSRGLFFYPSTLAAQVAAGLYTSVTLTVKRAASGGIVGAVPLNVWEHAYASQPGGQPALGIGPYSDPTQPMAPPRNATTTFNLPATWIADFASGAALGVGINGGGYSILLGPDEAPSSGTLTFS